jgi:hypothetical protein
MDELALSYNLNNETVLTDLYQFLTSAAPDSSSAPNRTSSPRRFDEITAIQLSSN